MPGNDFDGDGYDDLLWRRDDGLTTYWRGTAAGLVQSTTFSQLVDPAWEIAGTGDFDGDGMSDILWRKADGQLTTWLSNGSTFDASFNQMVETDWNVEAVGDFDGDGRDDIFWRRDDGLVTTWLANAQGGFDDAADPISFVGQTSSVQDAADVNGDGFDDVLWKADEEIVIWLSDGVLPAAGEAWTQDVIGGTSRFNFIAGQFTSDDRADIALSSMINGVTTGLTLGQSVDNHFRSFSSQAFNQQIPSISTGDFNADGTDDIVIFDGATLGVLLVSESPTSHLWEDGRLYYGPMPSDWQVIG